MKEIKLTQGKVALVDDEDFEYLNQFKWQAKYSKGHTFYAYRTSQQINGSKRVSVAMHREILKLGSFKENPIRVDHENRNGLDNQKINLRLASHIENCRNASSRNTASKYKGVSKMGDNWRARIYITGKAYGLGVFLDEKEAAIAYDNKARKVFKEFANLNFPKIFRSPVGKTNRFYRKSKSET